MDVSLNRKQIRSRQYIFCCKQELIYILVVEDIYYISAILHIRDATTGKCQLRSLQWWSEIFCHKNSNFQFQGRKIFVCLVLCKKKAVLTDKNVPLGGSKMTAQNSLKIVGLGMQEGGSKIIKDSRTSFMDVPQVEVYLLFYGNRTCFLQF